MAGTFMPVNPSVCMPTLSRSNNQINFKNSRLLFFSLSGLHHNAGSIRLLHTPGKILQQPASIVDPQKLKILQRLVHLGVILEYGNNFFLNLQAEWFNCMLFPLELMNNALSALSKSVLLGFVSILHLKSHKTKPMNVSFNELLGVDDIVLEFQDIISILHEKSEYKNFRAKLPIGVFLPELEKARRCSPSIVFIDYVDVIASQRENCDSDPNLVELHTEM
nr:ATPase, AAA-type, core, P-loop containing nucleoside triphosphate hydrolase [Tanacetum cinerariifolium]